MQRDLSRRWDLLEVRFDHSWFAKEAVMGHGSNGSPEVAVALARVSASDVVIPARDLRLLEPDHADVRTSDRCTSRRLNLIAITCCSQFIDDLEVVLET
jgi:hypothetical protein